VQMHVVGVGGVELVLDMTDSILGVYSPSLLGVPPVLALRESDPTSSHSYLFTRRDHPPHTHRPSLKMRGPCVSRSRGEVDCTKYQLKTIEVRFAGEILCPVAVALRWWCATRLCSFWNLGHSVERSGSSGTVFFRFLNNEKQPRSWWNILCQFPTRHVRSTSTTTCFHLPCVYQLRVLNASVLAVVPPTNWFFCFFSVCLVETMYELAGLGKFWHRWRRTCAPYMRKLQTSPKLVLYLPL